MILVSSLFSLSTPLSVSVSPGTSVLSSTGGGQPAGSAGISTLSGNRTSGDLYNGQGMKGSPGQGNAGKWLCS